MIKKHSLSVEEAQQGFRETLDIHLQKTWG